MKKFLLAASAGAAAMLAVAPAANAAVYFDVTVGDAPIVVPGNNDFKTDLSGLGYGWESIASQVTIDGNANYIIKFELLGTESSFYDTFTFGPISYTELVKGKASYFGAPIALGSTTGSPGAFGDGSMFTNNGGADGRDAGSGDAGFSVFLKDLSVGQSAFSSGDKFQTNVLYFGYDDQSARRPADDNHDDMIIRATIRAVPEPATWAMMVFGVAAVGMSMRRRSRNVRVAFS